MKKRLLIIILFLSAFQLTGYAQKEVRSQVRKGNKLYQKEQYSEAEIEYRKALELNARDRETNYNLANTLYKTDRNEEAGKIYQELLKEIQLLPKERAADLAHNAGNIAMRGKDYEGAIELYKESLRRRPTDEETRYNLALAQKLLEKEKQESGGGENQQQQDQQEQNPDQQEQDQQQEQKPQEQQEQKNQEQQQQAQSQSMSRDNAEKILEAYLQDEKDTQRKVEQMKQQQQQGRKSRPKNW